MPFKDITIEIPDSSTIGSKQYPRTDTVVPTAMPSWDIRFSNVYRDIVPTRPRP